MNRIERFYKIDQMLHARGVVSLDTFLTELEVSRATFKRDIEYLRDRLHAPIVWDRSAGGYRLDGGHAIGPVYELPGLWFFGQRAVCVTDRNQAGGGISHCFAPDRKRTSQQNG